MFVVDVVPLHLFLWIVTIRARLAPVLPLRRAKRIHSSAQLDHRVDAVAVAADDDDRFRLPQQMLVPL